MPASQMQMYLNVADTFSFPMTISNLLRAYYSCRKNKRRQLVAIQYETVAETQLTHLLHQLKSRSYQLAPSSCFVVTYPKLREIFAADFKDRVTHHLLINAIEPNFESRFIFDSYACRKDKGTHQAVKRLQSFLRKITQNQTRDACYLQLDIQSFFTSIDKKILYSILVKHLTKYRHSSDLLWLAQLIIFNDPTHNCKIKGNAKLLAQIPTHKSLFHTPWIKGLPIGNLTSQFFANVYLNELDQFVKRELKVKYYLRYVDDLVLLSRHPQQLTWWRHAINQFLHDHLSLQLHPAKDRTDSVYSGIDWLGYIVKPDYVLCRRRVVANLKSKLHAFNQGYLLQSSNQHPMATPIINSPTADQLKTILSVINSYYGHFKLANTYHLRKNLYEKNFGILMKYLKPVGNYDYFVPKPIRPTTTLRHRLPTSVASVQTGA